MMPLEAWLVGAGAVLVAMGLLVAFIPAMTRNDYDEPEPAPTPALGLPLRPARPDSETRVLHVVPALCGCADGGIGHLLDNSNPWCRRCGGAR